MNLSVENRIAVLFISFLLTVPVPVASAQGQGASAQGQGASHGLTIDVQRIDDISVSGSPEVTISEIGTWTEMNGVSDLTVTSNAPSDRKIEVSATASGSGNSNRGAVGLRVKAQSTPGGGGESGWFTITTVGDQAFSDGDFLTGFKNVDASYGLTYEAQADVNYNPEETMSIAVMYTLTGA